MVYEGDDSETLANKFSIEHSNFIFKYFRPWFFNEIKIEGTIGCPNKFFTSKNWWRGGIWGWSGRRRILMINIY